MNAKKIQNTVYLLEVYDTYWELKFELTILLYSKRGTAFKKNIQNSIIEVPKFLGCD